MDHHREQEAEGRVEGSPAIRERLLHLGLGIAAADTGDGAGSYCAVVPLRRRGRSSRRNMEAGAGSWPAPALVDRHVAIVDPLLVHPLSAMRSFPVSDGPLAGTAVP